MKSRFLIFGMFLFVLNFSTFGQTKKNVLFIAVDDLKPKLGCYGDTIIQSPNIDKLAAQGFIFRNNHCQQAVCGPSRASILTGKRPDYTRVWDLKTLIRDKRPDIVTMPQYFKQQGYLTAGVGKVFDLRSVDELNDSVSWSFPYKHVKGSNVKGGGYVFEKRRVSTEAPDVDDSVTMDAEVAREAIDYLKKFARDDQPFFLAVGFYKPHLPFVAPKKYWDLYDTSVVKLPPFQEHSKNAPAYAFQPGWEVRSQYIDVPKDPKIPIPENKQLQLIHGYYACVSFIDRQIGKVIDELDRLGLRDNTIIVLWGDHGWHLGDHNMWCKHTNFEQATRSLLIISAGKDRTGITDSPTEFVDVYPTICALSGVPLPDSLDGKNLTPLLEHKTGKVKDFAVSQFPRWPDKMGYAFRNNRYRYVIWMKNNFRSDKQPFDESLVDAEELYDYKTDPLETVSYAYDSTYADAKRRMKAMALKYFEEEYEKYHK